MKPSQPDLFRVKITTPPRPWIHPHETWDPPQPTPPPSLPPPPTTKESVDYWNQFVPINCRVYVQYQYLVPHHTASTAFLNKQGEPVVKLATHNREPFPLECLYAIIKPGNISVPHRLFDLPEIARQLNLSHNSVRHLIRKNEIPYIRINRNTYGFLWHLVFRRILNITIHPDPKP